VREQGEGPAALSGPAEGVDCDEGAADQHAAGGDGRVPGADQG